MKIKCISNKYHNFFYLKEFDRDPSLRSFAYCLILIYVIIFDDWSGRAITNQHSWSHFACWPFFPNCSPLHFLTYPPDGNSYQITFILASILATFSGLSLFFRKFVLFHFSLTLLLFFEVFFLFVWSMDYIGNYNYYHVVCLFFLVFVTPRLAWLKLLFVLLYFLAGAVKLHHGWILGTYFTSLVNGMALVPDYLVPAATNAVIALELFGPWLLLSNKMSVRLSTVAIFAMFHLYSSIYVGYRYPVTVMPLLLVLFCNKKKFEINPRIFISSSLGTFCFLVGLVINSIGDIIPGDEKLTLEGNFYGLYMFEANHQCRTEINITEIGKHPYTISDESIKSTGRCDYYRLWRKIRRICEAQTHPPTIAWKFDHSINGGPFYRIVDSMDACSLDYKAFRHNEWIKLPESGAEVVGYPVKNCLSCRGPA